MPKRFFKKFAPHPDTITQNKYMRFLGNSLFLPALWHFNRHSVAKAFAIGLACMWIPSPGQSILAAALAIFFRANIPMAVALVFVTNPVTGPPMYYGAYILGARLLGQPQLPHFEMNLEWLGATFGQIWEPMIVGCLVVAVISAVLGYYGIQFFWRFHIHQKLKQRKERQSLALKTVQPLLAPPSPEVNQALGTKLGEDPGPQ
ncbi:MAG TPA: DUF2062 domain-containing protein [Thiolinea sp.]|nr:DUF2062 domain-containing protein [Thiolinea sp.]